MAAQMRTSRAGLDLMKRFEGYRARYEELPDGRWIIGYGHVRMQKEGSRVTEAEAEAILREYDLPKIERTVMQAVLAPLNQNEFDALVSLAFNIGDGAFTSSDVVAAINGGNRLQAAQAFDSWRYAEIGGRLQMVDVLVRRRAAEKALFLSTVGHAPVAASSVYRALQNGVDSGPVLPRLTDDLIARSDTPTASTKRTAYITSDAQTAQAARTATEEAAEAVRLQMEKILYDDGSEISSSNLERPLMDDAPEPASPEDITAAISELAGHEETMVRKSVWPQHADLSPPPVFERELLPASKSGNIDSKPNGHAHVGHIDDLEEVRVNPDYIAKAVAANVREDNAERQRSYFLAAMQGILAVFGFCLAIYGLARQLGGIAPLTPEVGPLAVYFPAFMILFGGLLLMVMGYYCYKSWTDPD